MEVNTLYKIVSYSNWIWIEKFNKFDQGGNNSAIANGMNSHKFQFSASNENVPFTQDCLFEISIFWRKIFKTQHMTIEQQYINEKDSSWLNEWGIAFSIIIGHIIISVAYLFVITSIVKHRNRFIFHVAYRSSLSCKH